VQRERLTGGRTRRRIDRHKVSSPWNQTIVCDRGKAAKKKGKDSSEGSGGADKTKTDAACGRAKSANPHESQTIVLKQGISENLD